MTRVLILLLLLAASLLGKTTSPKLATFIAEAEQAHGAFGRKAAQFLVDGMPPADRASLKKDFLLENLDLALKARSQFDWAGKVPEEVFLNDVLPYASLDETREAWRPEFHKLCAPLVKEAKSATEAAQILNKEFFNLINVHYNTGRKKPNQSPAESRVLGMATCTGLSIILVDACRSVGVPARIAGTALWSNKRGNHTWVEIYDNGEWHFTGADEYDAKGLNRGWFTGDAGKAIADDWKHAIWATSWKKTDHHFPMVWDLRNKNVPAVNVTQHYAKDQPVEKGEIYLRLWDQKGGKRIVGQVALIDAGGKELQVVTTKAGTTDLNDMPALSFQPGQHQLKVSVGDEGKVISLKQVKAGQTLDLHWETLGQNEGVIPAIHSWLELLPEERHLSVPEQALTREEAREALGVIAHKLIGESLEVRKAELTERVIKAAGKEMRYLEKTFGEAPADGRSLWISMHGGGGAPPRVNDQQWQNQIRLYEPKEGIYVAPRAPTDTWNLWHEGHIDALFDRLIEHMVSLRGVNPHKIYLMGYSAGGDGVYQLAPRMADRFAAAAMMAGHPNDAVPLGLRNLPFMIFMGGKDAAYKRNEVAVEWGKKLDALQEADPQGYPHKTTIYEELGHWMERRDAEALPWMVKHQRNPWPRKIVWHQSGRTHERFYWLANAEPQKGQTIRAEVEGQKITVTSEVPVTLRLSDQLLDLDQEVIVILNGKEVHKGKCVRQTKAIWDSLNERFDPFSVASATLELKP
ncbi:MAG: transglutaminase domain-containing protein [Akkermansiaceae bacterium]